MKEISLLPPELMRGEMMTGVEGRDAAGDVKRPPAARKDFLGNILVKSGVITGEQLEEVLKLQRSQRGERRLPLGKALVKRGYCTEEDVARAVARQRGVPFVSLNDYPIDMRAASLIPPEVARKYSVLPIGFEDGHLVVAMMHPNNVVAIDDLHFLTGYDIHPVVCPDSELLAAIENYARGAVTVGQEEEDAQVEAVPEAAIRSDQPAVRLAGQILQEAVRARASDVHIEPQERCVQVRFRIDGVLHDVMSLPRRIHPMLVSRFKVMANMDIAERRIPQDGRMSVRVDEKTLDVRLATIPTTFGEKITCRLLDRSARILTLEELGFPEEALKKYRKLVILPYGFILVTGPTGSGKTTTLYASLMAVNSREKHIITVEDPIEYRIEGVNQVQVNTRAGLTFATGLRSILRCDPDIIMVGEIRDRETAQIAVESALTGHLVFSTLHTNDAAGAITRLGEMGIEPFLTASTLVGVVAQRLVRILCPHCRWPLEAGAAELLEAAPDFPIAPGEDRVKIYRPAGCVRCGGTGYRGRTGVFELLVVSEPIRRLVLSRASASEIRETAIREGMVTMRQNGFQKVREGITSVEEVLRVVV